MAPEVVKGGDAGHDFVSIIERKLNDYRDILLRLSIGGVSVY